MATRTPLPSQTRPAVPAAKPALPSAMLNFQAEMAATVVPVEQAVEAAAQATLPTVGMVVNPLLAWVEMRAAETVRRARPRMQQAIPGMLPAVVAVAHSILPQAAIKSAAQAAMARSC